MLDRDRSAAHSSATAALVGPQFHALADKMATLAREVPLTPIADRSCAEVLPSVVTAAYENLLRRTSSLPAPLASEDPAADEQWLAAYEAAETALHAAELCRPAEVSVPGRAAEDLVDGLTRVSVALRDQHDAVLAAACVHRAADTPRIAATTGYVLGRLHEEQRLAVLRSRCAAPLETLAVPVSIAVPAQGPAGLSSAAAKPAPAEQLPSTPASGSGPPTPATPTPTGPLNTGSLSSSVQPSASWSTTAPHVPPAEGAPQ
jgi:hypothetical protein